MERRIQREKFVLRNDEIKFLSDMLPDGYEISDVLSDEDMSIFAPNKKESHKLASLRQLQEYLASRQKPALSDLTIER